MMRRLPAGLLIMAAIGTAVWADQKTVRDPAEYNAYITALDLRNPAQKAAAMVAFAEKYPGSVMRIDAWTQAMAAYQQSGDQAGVEKAVRQIIKLEPDNVRALSILTWLERARATLGDKSALAEIGANADRGLKDLETWSAPDGMSEPDFQKLRGQMAMIFNGAAGFAALEKRDYAAARKYYLKSVQIDPTNRPDLYQLAIADLQANPVETEGFWYIAKAINLAGAQKDEAAEKSMIDYGKAKYREYHGSEDGWDELVVAAAGQVAPPADFAAKLTRAPTPAELAVKAAARKDPATLSFSEWEFILSQRDASPANEAAAKKVWEAIQAKQKNGAVKLEIPAIIVSVDEDVIHAAITHDNQKANKADLEITLTEPLMSPAALGVPVLAVGVLTGYRVSPFMFVMKDAELQDTDSP